MLETDDGATILFAWHGLRTVPSGNRELVGSMTHVTDDERYRWLNDAFCSVAGESPPPPTATTGADVGLGIYKLAWDPLAE